MPRAVLTFLAVAFLAPPSTAYTLRYWPETAYVGQAAVVVTLDYYDAWDCPNALRRVQSSGAGVIRLELGRSVCPLGAGRQHSISATLPALPAGEYKVEVVEDGWPKDPFLFGAFEVFEPSLCRPELYRLCLHDGRFSVDVSWRDFAGNQGAGRAVPQDARHPFGPDTGFFWFFSEANLELMTKVLDGCALNGRFWIFLSPASTVAYDVMVTDLVTGASKLYHNDAGNTPALTADTDALPCS
jgi:hypothetical protein